MMVDPPVATEEHKTGKQVRYLTCTRPNSSVADDNDDDDAHRVRRRFCRSVTISRADGSWLRAREISLSVTAEIGSEGDALGLFLLVLLLFVRGENRGRSDSSKALKESAVLARGFLSFATFSLAPPPFTRDNGTIAFDPWNRPLHFQLFGWMELGRRGGQGRQRV